MRRLQFLLFALVIFSLAAFGQSNVMIQNFDVQAWTDSVHWLAQESGTTWALALNTSDMKEGTGALDVKATLGPIHTWGTFAQLGYNVYTGTSPMDWSASDSVSVWLKVVRGPATPANMVWRIHIQDRPNPTDPTEDWIYENTTIIDNVHDWIQLRIPFLDRVSTGVEPPDTTGFIIAPSNWNMPFNNKKLDRDKIVGWSFAIVSTTIDADSVEVMYDDFERYGVRSFPVIIFAGKDWPSYYGTWTWGGSSISVQPNLGRLPGEAAVQWTQGDDYGNGWTGWGGNISPAINMAGAWPKDTLKIWLKADSCGPLRAQFESPQGKRGMVWQPIEDGQWHQYTSALRDMTPVDTAGGNFLNFDPTNITTFGVMADADNNVHSGRLGRVIYLTEIWTGTPTLDVIPPAAPQNLSVIGGQYSNTLTWDVVPNEPGVLYNVFYADHAWTDPADPTVEDIPPYGLTSALATHLLRSPNTDQAVSYRYGVTAKDAAGNLSTATVTPTGSTSVMAHGVPTFSLTPPATFVADGDVAEWSGITPFFLSLDHGTAHDVPNFRITGGDADLSANAYLAVDATYLYVAFDVTDNVVDTNTSASATDYNQDCPDLFIGTYDWRGPHHNGYTGGAHPDYHIRFSANRVRLDNGGVDIMYPGANYAWVVKSLSPGYVVEARIPWTVLAAALTSRNDVVFVPKEGMRIPMDFAINDNDGIPNTGTRHAIMCYSEISFDNSYQDQWRWSYTWIGNLWTPNSVKQNGQVALTYALNQNYPNPFNPATQIEYSIAKAGYVSLKVYDLLGQEVATLVNSEQTAGNHTVKFDAVSGGRSLASGVYFYRLESGSFVATHKMIVLK